MRITKDRVERASLDGQPVWLVYGTKTLPDGTQRPCGHCLPANALEIRAAEYGIDHKDIETLLDVVIWEPYLHHLNDGVDHDHPQFVWNAETIDEAREHHLKRVAAVKKLLAHPDQHDHNPALDPIRKSHGIDPEMVALRAEHFGLQRESWRRHRAASAERQDVGHKERLRNQIAEHRARLERGDGE